MKITEKRTQEVLALIFLLSHFGTFYHLYHHRTVTGSMSEESFNSFLFILLPLFGVYTTLIVKYIVNNRLKEEDKTGQVSNLFLFLTVFITGGFVAYLNVTIANFADHVSSIETYATKLGMADTLFGVYLSIIMKELFKEKSQIST